VKASVGPTIPTVPRPSSKPVETPGTDPHHVTPRGLRLDEVEPETERVEHGGELGERSPVAFQGNPLALDRVGKRHQLPATTPSNPKSDQSRQRATKWMQGLLYVSAGCRTAVRMLKMSECEERMSDSG
jgi:hypothetical protein